MYPSLSMIDEAELRRQELFAEGSARPGHPTAISHWRNVRPHPSPKQPRPGHRWIAVMRALRLLVGATTVHASSREVDARSAP